MLTRPTKSKQKLLKCACGVQHREKQSWEKIPTKQKRKLSICPKCGKRFYFWQLANKHAHIFKHYGHYGVIK